MQRYICGGGRLAVIVEATYGVSRHLPREEREERFCGRIREILSRGGRVLLPVVALGRAQVPPALHAVLHGTYGRQGVPSQSVPGCLMMPVRPAAPRARQS